MKVSDIAQALQTANTSEFLLPQPFDVGTTNDGLTLTVMPVHVTKDNNDPEALKRLFSADAPGGILNQNVDMKRYFIHVYAEVPFSNELRTVVEALVYYIKPVFDALGAMGRVAGLIIRTESGIAHTILGPTASTYWWIDKDQKSAHCGPTVTKTKWGVPTGFNGPPSCTTNMGRQFSPDEIPKLIHSQLTNESTDVSPWMSASEVNDTFERALVINKEKTMSKPYERTQTITDLAKKWWKRRTGGKIPPSGLDLFPDETYSGTISRKRRSRRGRPSKRGKRRSSRRRSRRTQRRR